MSGPVLSLEEHRRRVDRIRGEFFPRVSALRSRMQAARQRPAWFVLPAYLDPGPDPLAFGGASELPAMICGCPVFFEGNRDEVLAVTRDGETVRE